MDLLSQVDPPLDPSSSHGDFLFNEGGEGGGGGGRARMDYSDLDSFIPAAPPMAGPPSASPRGAVRLRATGATGWVRSHPPSPPPPLHPPAPTLTPTSSSTSCTNTHPHLLLHPPAPTLTPTSSSTLLHPTLQRLRDSLTYS
ncbi:hypothetical protein CRUP_001638 [Coryphaenoides rupestris]|nr:hypothetical protein CRUP_001638 [Coryphaenoides rupestris]